MAFDYGSIDLGLKNPFKLEGKVTALRGVIQTLTGMTLLFFAAGLVKEDQISGWILMLFGIVNLAIGLKTAASGIYSTLRYFVGRNHPTSLAYNFSKSESSTAHSEKNDVAYRAKTLEEMLVGRKNSTFVEPKGFIARLLHSLLPKLLFLPYPVRNMTQRIFNAWISTIVALVSYALIAFVSLTGFAGEVGELAFPIYSCFLMLFIFLTWRSAGRPISRKAESTIETLGTASFTKIIALSIVLPLVIGLVMSFLMNKTGFSKQDIEQFLNQLPSFNSGLYLIGIVVFALIGTAIIGSMISARLNKVDPVTEVSELRENWQESVHPNEIFINLDNLVMANRRYREVPNRVYKELDPKLQEQVDGKGGFNGEMIQEVQPKFSPMNLGKTFELSRLLSLLFGNIFFIITLIFSVLLAYQAIDLAKFVSSQNINSFETAFNSANLSTSSQMLINIAQLFLIGAIFKAFARLMTNSAHVFFAEMQFESLLVYFKCEGTFTESKISTGTGIHDSTRSENTLVRSSITPWIIVSRIVSSTFAATGLKNLEHPRHILEMHKDESQLDAIKHDIVSFLKDRESIASITSERDLGNASQLYQLNQQTRAMSGQSIAHKQDEEAAGFLRAEQPESAK
ncbi:hypothetical protein ABMY35_20355 [Pseudoalteromonas sp. BZB3]|uniref:hypothetical protein n=1 Tax=Pseudoalteromonas sp. BZB3 TaxID=3136670 RepID=UPI0032C454AE